MALTATVLFDYPQREISTVIAQHMTRASAVSIVTGFATPGGMASITPPLKVRPSILKALIVGAATYPGFEALDDLVAAGVAPDRVYVHLGHTSRSGAHKNPFVRFHPMLHSKIYYVELADSKACALIGSHNVTAFALNGLNGEAAVLLEGAIDSPEFRKIRSHIETARTQAVLYSPAMKEAYAWWMREFIDGLRAEIRIPQDFTTVRTILLFATAARVDRPKAGDQLYFEIPAGIEQIESLKTEVHLFLFDKLPPDPSQALRGAARADARYTCITLGAENKQGNLEVNASWRIDVSPPQALRRVPAGHFRPNTSVGMQQVRAEIKRVGVAPCEYLFDREHVAWNPEFSEEGRLPPPKESMNKSLMEEIRPSDRAPRDWKLVKGLVRRSGLPRETDEAALRLAAPESGSFTLVSLRRRQLDKTRDEERLTPKGE